MDLINKIYLGDCYKLIKEIPDKSIDLIYTDIPYDICYSGSGVLKAKLKKIKKELQEHSENIIEGIDYKILDEFVRVLKNIYIYIWCSKSQIYDIMNYFLTKPNINFNILVWCKDNPVPFGASPFLSDIEYCLCFYEKGVKFNNGVTNKHKWYKSHKNMYDKADYGHPTCKPVEFIKTHLLNSTQPGDIVLDPFAGSGSTLVAAKETGRKYLGIEINEDYYKICDDRLKGINQKGELNLFYQENLEQMDLFEEEKND